MGDQAHALSLPSGQPHVDHLNNSGDHSYDPLAETDPDVNALLNENGFIQNTKYFTIDDMNHNLHKNNNSLSILNANVRSL